MRSKLKQRLRVVGVLICTVLLMTRAHTQDAGFNQAGIVTGADGSKQANVSITNKKSKQTVMTNVEGGYSIRANHGDSIEFVLVGHLPFTVVANTNKRKVDVHLSENAEVLNDVVVTALGIKREERELGYAFSEVSGGDINKAKETNVINSLAGKVPGLIVNSTAGGPAGSSRVIIRGNTSITGNNQPLYVIDGVPMDNSNYGQVSGDRYGGGVDMGDAISGINPDDIDKISVLKGPSASALYGSAAANGVILITTKKGASSKELGIELNSTNTWESQLTRQDNVQYIYGQGRAQLLPQDREQAVSTLFTNFGPRLDPNLMITGFDGEERPYKLVENNISNFFRTGFSLNNTLSLTSATEKSNFRFSVSDMRYQDIIPNSDIRRNTFTLSGRSKFGEKLSFDARAMYMNEKVKNRAGLGDSPLNIGQNFNGLANNVDQAQFAKNYKTAQGDYIEWGGGQFRLNPYWILNEMHNETMKNRITGAFNANYNVNKWFSILARASTDITFLDYEAYSPRSTPGAINGALGVTHQTYTTTQADVIATANNKLSKSLKLSTRIGASINYRVRKGTVANYSNMQVTDVVSLNSFADRTIVENDIKRRINSVFGLMTLSVKNYLFFDATLRTDASSTLPVNNNVYTYPSLSGSFIFTDAFNIDKNILSFGKLRVSAAEVGSDTDPYLLDLYYNLGALPFNGVTYGGISTVVNGTKAILPPLDLKPTRTRSFEVGTNLKFLKNRITLDATYYTSQSRDQINIIPAATSSGFTRQLINAGVITNKGVEIMISGSPLSEKSKLQWDLSINFARNVNHVESLAEGIPFLSLSDARWLGLSVVAKPGEQYGSILGYDFQRDPKGNVILDSNTLIPARSADRTVLGKGVFDWTGGITSRLSYGNFSLNTTFDIKYGADMFSMTNMFLMVRGSSKETLPGRAEWIQSEEDRIAAQKTLAEWQAAGNVRGYVPKGVTRAGFDGQGKPIYVQNTRAVDPSAYWGQFYNDGNGVATPFIYKATYVKVREIVLNYRIPRTFTRKLGVKDASISMVARNPFILYKDIPNVDPDSNYNNGNGQGLEYGSLPTRRGWGVNLNVKF